MNPVKTEEIGLGWGRKRLQWKPDKALINPPKQLCSKYRSQPCPPLGWNGLICSGTRCVQCHVLLQFPIPQARILSGRYLYRESLGLIPCSSHFPVAPVHKTKYYVQSMKFLPFLRPCPLIQMLELLYFYWNGNYCTFFWRWGGEGHSPCP